VGLFGKKYDVSLLAETPTELDSEWFAAWATELQTALGPEVFRQRLSADTQLDAAMSLFSKACAIIDLNTRQVAIQHWDAKARQTYERYFDSDDATPWGLVSVVVGLEPSGSPEWEATIVGRMKQQMKRFAEIFIDPSVAG